jgi:hypothetical protein
MSGPASLNHGGIIEKERARPERLILIRSPQNPMIAIVLPFNALFTYHTTHCFVYNHRFRQRNYFKQCQCGREFYSCLFHYTIEACAMAAC